MENREYFQQCGRSKRGIARRIAEWRVKLREPASSISDIVITVTDGVTQPADYSQRTSYNHLCILSL